jgi:hypothetical protein
VGQFEPIGDRFGSHRITPDGEIEVSLEEFQKIEATACL